MKKKCLYIGHAYHAKTLSMKFLIDYLQEYFDVDIVLDYSQERKDVVDYTIISDKYFVVIFWQLLPPRTY